MKFTLALWRGSRENTRKVGSPRSYHATLYFLNKKKKKKRKANKKRKTSSKAMLLVTFMRRFVRYGTIGTI